MKLIRFRRPSLKTVLGVTKAKKRLKKSLGITAAMKPFRAWTNAKRRVKRHVGYYSLPARVLRNGVPTPMGIGSGGASSSSQSDSQGCAGCFLLCAAFALVANYWDAIVAFGQNVATAAAGIAVVAACAAVVIGAIALVVGAVRMVRRLVRRRREAALAAYRKRAADACRSAEPEMADWAELRSKRSRLHAPATEVRQAELAAFMDAVQQTLADGRLERDEVRHLRQIVKRLELRPDEVKPLLLNVYRDRQIEALADRVLAPAEERLLDDMRRAFAITDSEIAAERAEAERFRGLKRIRDGELPTTDGKGLPLKRRETCHYRCPAQRLAGRDMPSPDEPLDVVSSGELAVTDERVLYAASRTLRMPLDDVASVDVNTRRNVLRLAFRRRKRPLAFKLPDALTAEATLVGALGVLYAGQRAAQAAAAH